MNRQELQDKIKHHEDILITLKQELEKYPNELDKYPDEDLIEWMKKLLLEYGLPKDNIFLDKISDVEYKREDGYGDRPGFLETYYIYFIGNRITITHEIPNGHFDDSSDIYTKDDNISEQDKEQWSEVYDTFQKVIDDTNTDVFDYEG